MWIHFTMLLNMLTNPVFASDQEERHIKIPEGRNHDFDTSHMEDYDD